jgi:mono/diheme cytochrome c family protein
MSRAWALALLSLAACSAGAPAGPSYYKDVEPILQANCLGCHVDGGIAPFALDSYAKVKDKLAKVVYQVDSRTMPPWPPGPKSPPLLHSRALPDDQVATILGWAAAGAAPGSQDDHRVRPPNVLGVRDDLEVGLAQPYSPDEKLTDDYRCFVMDPKIKQATFVTGYDVLPGVAAQVHHVILFVALDQGDTLARLEALDGKDGKPGYPCFGGPMIDSSSQGPLGLPPYRFLGGWAPGAGAVPMPDGTGIYLPPRARVVMQVHYNARNGRAPDQTAAHLELTPVGVREAFLYPLANERLAVPAGVSSQLVDRSFPLGAGVPTFTIYGLFPHMHLFGKHISLELVHAGQTQTLIDLPHWEFHWQGSYQLVTPVRAAAGDSLRLQCVYDNSVENQPLIDGVPQEPKPLRWGEKTTDEMCLVFLYATL